MPAARVQTGLTGAAGEYYVAAELSRRGWLATVTLKNAPRVDVLAQRPTGEMVFIQTKTAGEGSGGFQLGAKDESGPYGSNDWYIFVKLGTEVPARYWVVPRLVVSAVVYSSHEHYKSYSGKNGARRTLRSSWIAGYEDAWDLLGMDCRTISYRGDASRLELIRRFGFPPEHPRFSLPDEL